VLTYYDLGCKVLVMIRLTATWLFLLLLLAPSPALAQSSGRGVRTGGAHHVVVTSNPSQGLEEGIPRTSWYAKGIEHDIQGRYDESFQAFNKARREFAELLKKRPTWELTIRGWIAKAEFQADQSRSLRTSRYYRYSISRYPRYYRTAAKHHKWLAIRAYTGRADRKLAKEIVEEYQQILRHTSYDQRPRLALAAFYHELGRHKEGKRTFQAARNVDRTYLAKDVAYYYAAAGNLKLAFRYLQTAVRHRPSDRRYILRANDFDRLRGDPRFRELVGEL